MPDVAIQVAGTASLPLDYEVPNAQELMPLAAFATFDGAAAAVAFLPILRIKTPGGLTVAELPADTSIPAASSGDATWAPFLRGDIEQAPTPGAGVTTETLFLDSTSAGVSTANPLTAGGSYLITVQGTFSNWNHALDVGTPNANAMFPGALGGRISTEVGHDADTLFAAWSGATYGSIGHNAQFEIDIGSGYAHREPDGGPYTTPQANYLYRYTVTGQGAVARFRVNDAPLADNYGKLQIVVQSFGGGSTGGGGGGSLVPPATPDYALLEVLAGVPTWTLTLDGGSA